MKAKTYAGTAIAFFAAFFLGSLCLWHYFVYPTFLGEIETGHGDLLRVGGIARVDAATEPRIYELHHTEFADYLKGLALGEASTYDVLTIGDSFSNGGGGVYYQDILGAETSLRILNVPAPTGKLNAIETYYVLERLGYLDRIQPRIVILESVERYIDDRYGEKLLETPKTTDTELRQLIAPDTVGLPDRTREEGIVDSDGKDASKAEPDGQGADGQAQTATGTENTGAERLDWLFPPIMLNANGEYLVNKWFTLWHPDQLSSNTYCLRLTKPFFTNPGRENQLLFYDEELAYTKRPIRTDMVNQNLETAAALAKRHGSRLYFMPVADKIDLYHPWLSDADKARWGENPFIRELHAMARTYTIIDTRAILRPLLEQGEPDIWWQDDTHWTWKAAETISHAIKEMLS